MKNTIPHSRSISLESWVLSLLAAGSLCLMISGCGTIKGLIASKPVTTIVTNTIPARTEIVFVTNQPPAQIVVVTNTVQGLPVIQTVTNQSPPIVVTNIVTIPGSNVVTVVTNGFEANPALLGYLSKAQGLNAALNPTPTSPIINGVLGGLAALAGLVATWQTKRLQREQTDHASTKDALATATDVGTTLVDNFEQLRKVALTIPGYTPEIDHKVMDTVKTVQAIAGVKSEIHDIVEQHTDDTVVVKS